MNNISRKRTSGEIKKLIATGELKVNAALSGNTIQPASFISARIRVGRTIGKVRRENKVKRMRRQIAFLSIALVAMLATILFGFSAKGQSFDDAEMKYIKKIDESVRIVEDLNNQIDVLEKENARLRQIEKAIDHNFKEDVIDTINYIETEFEYVEMPIQHKIHVVREASKYDNVDPHLIFALIKQESQNDPNAVSPTGAKGYGQFIYNTGVMTYENLLKKGKYQKDMAFDPYINIEMTCRYFSWLMDLKKNEDIALAYYNGFSDPNYVSNVRRWYPENIVAMITEGK